MVKKWISDKTDKLMIAREWLNEKDPTLFFQNVENESE